MKRHKLTIASFPSGILVGKEGGEETVETRKSWWSVNDSQT